MADKPETPMEMTVEALARITAGMKLRERVRIAKTLTDRADVLRGEGKIEVGAELDIVAAELTNAGQIRVAPAQPSSPFGSAVVDGAHLDDGDGLPAMQFNTDEDDAMRLLHAGARVLNNANLLRD